MLEMLETKRVDPAKVIRTVDANLRQMERDRMLGIEPRSLTFQWSVLGAEATALAELYGWLDRDWLHVD